MGQFDGAPVNNEKNNEIVIKIENAQKKLNELRERKYELERKALEIEVQEGHLEDEIAYTKHYSTNLNSISKAVDAMLSRDLNISNIDYYRQEREPIDIFLKVCAEMNHDDYVIIKNKIDKLDEIVKPILEENRIKPGDN